MYWSGFIFEEDDEGNVLNDFVLVIVIIVVELLM